MLTIASGAVAATLAFVKADGEVVGLAATEKI
jgi:hypothetical protein